MRAIWKGAIAFGMVSIPVRVFSATETRDVSFVQVRRSDASRIRYRRVAESDGAEVAYGDIAKGYLLPSGEVVVLEDSDFADLPLRTAKEIEVLAFVPDEQVDPILYAKAYYLEPDVIGVKPYVLLRDALQRSGRVALTKVALRSRESLAALRVRDDVLVLHTMLWPEEVRTPQVAGLDGDVELGEAAEAMADTLVSTLSTDFDPERYSDRYREALEDVISAKVAGREVVVPPEGTTTSTVVDLMEALRASVAAAARPAEPKRDSA